MMRRKTPRHICNFELNQILFKAREQFFSKVNPFSEDRLNNFENASFPPSLKVYHEVLEVYNLPSIIMTRYNVEKDRVVYMAMP